MSINADFSQRVVIHTAELAWQPSPQAGVERIPLDRIGAEVARATSLVRYAPGSTFPSHGHGGGEEILVLAGVFSDEHGDYPAGSYLRNPPGTRHAPFTREGCTLLVKLWQFAPDDDGQLCLDTANALWQPGLVEGLRVLPLHEHDGVSTALVNWAPGTHFAAHTHPGGEEIFVIEGELRDEAGVYPAGSWLRNPRWSRHAPWSDKGALIYVKVGHLGATTCWELAYPSA
ncbi:anti-sigma factor ChrR (cupin superfamily) [Pseudomonas fluvialis]|uniref:Anti-sigma factor ChrR (Cupin superfamily) n=1 Tax=Pseudomonas fluvialis TaxID=1793966 RepID=A0A7X0ETF8_9PSED|nr:cupin domain-containing protein [Pseudomonas fluvialis]MBB6340536.1 anti-sigma factor ChrR (cupin superfamily) [Pseudomonas fluvialis]